MKPNEMLSSMHKLNEVSILSENLSAEIKQMIEEKKLVPGTIEFLEIANQRKKIKELTIKILLNNDMTDFINKHGPESIVTPEFISIMKEQDTIVNEFSFVISTTISMINNIKQPYYN